MEIKNNHPLATIGIEELAEFTGFTVPYIRNLRCRMENGKADPDALPPAIKCGKRDKLRWRVDGVLEWQKRGEQRDLARLPRTKGKVGRPRKAVDPVGRIATRSQGVSA